MFVNSQKSGHLGQGQYDPVYWSVVVMVLSYEMMVNASCILSYEMMVNVRSPSSPSGSPLIDIWEVVGDGSPLQHVFSLLQCSPLQHVFSLF